VHHKHLPTVSDQLGLRAHGKPGNCDRDSGGGGVESPSKGGVKREGEGGRESERERENTVFSFTSDEYLD
jgi:hypothetical protein